MPDMTHYLTLAEWYALGGGLVMGWLATEAVKRIWRTIRWHGMPYNYHPSCLDTAWALPLLGFVITALSTWSIWPVTGLFPHPIFAALLAGLSAPISYKILIALLRKLGQDWLADILTGQKMVTLK